MTSPVDAERLLREGAAPEGVTVDGDLYLREDGRIRSLPDGMTVLGNLHIRDCPRLEGEVRLDRVSKNCFIWNCPAMDAVSVGRAGGRVDIQYCGGVGSVRVERAGGIHLRGLPSLAEIDYSETGCLDVWGSGIVRWPKPKGNENIMIWDCPFLVEMPTPFRAADLTIVDCPSLRGLPADTDIRGIRGDVHIQRSGLGTIGPGVKVGGRLTVRDCPKIHRIDARVEGSMRVEECPRFDPDARPSNIPPIPGVSP